MLLDCEKLINWKMSNILQQLQDQKASYMEIMTLKNESKNIKELPRTYNHLDEYTDETKIIHMTGRLTQPWKTGLPIDFTINKAKKILGVIPREPILTLLGKRPSHYQKHPNQKIEIYWKNFECNDGYNWYVNIAANGVGCKIYGVVTGTFFDEVKIMEWT